MVNSKVSVVSVTLNDCEGLSRTLSSLMKLATKPAQIIIIDGGSSDETDVVVGKFVNSLPIVFSSGRDSGIYDAMNKGHLKVSTELVHYLNGGDEVFGDPYSAVDRECLLPVCIFDPHDGRSWVDRVKLLGFGYCHQGVIFRAGHPVYDLKYKVGADFDLITRCFPRGLNRLPMVHAGGVRYHLGGVSSRLVAEGNAEIIAISKHRFRFWQRVFVQLQIYCKSFIPRSVRRGLFRLTGRSLLAD